MDSFAGRDGELDVAVRKQLATWFPDHKTAILEQWKLERIYKISNAQPAQYKDPLPANANRPSNMYRGKALPEGIFVCGDHVATATLNGALESGVKAGEAAATKAISTQNSELGMADLSM
jgi:predicted NAD/FAD-dependent oxidoreductase